MAEPASPARMGEESSVSARLGPGGTVTRWEPAPSFPLRVLMKVVSFSVFNSWREAEHTRQGRKRRQNLKEINM